MRPSRSILTLFLLLPLMAAAQHSTNPAGGGVQPQVWPPPQSPSQVQAPAAAQNTPGFAPAVGPAAPGGQIQLDVVVTDKAGNLIGGLNRSDFTLFDDNRPAQIESFQAHGGPPEAPQPPVQIILMIDTVNIGFREVSYSRYGIDQFLRSNGGRLAAPVSIYWYTDSGIEGGDTSTDGNALTVKLDAAEGHLRSINRSAGAWGAIERYDMSVETLDRVVHAAAAQPGRKLLIWIGPGWPMLDNPNMQMTLKDQQKLFANVVELSTLLREAHMELYSVTPGMPNPYTFVYESYLKGVKKASQTSLPDLDLKVLAVQSGGLVMSPSNDLAAEIEQCARNASPYYSLSFTPPRADGPNEYHELKVRVDKPSLTARTNTGYYNQPPGMQTPR